MDLARKTDRRSVKASKIREKHSCDCYSCRTPSNSVKNGGPTREEMSDAIERATKRLDTRK